MTSYLCFHAHIDKINRDSSLMGRRWWGLDRSTQTQATTQHSLVVCRSRQKRKVYPYDPMVFGWGQRTLEECGESSELAESWAKDTLGWEWG